MGVMGLESGVFKSEGNELTEGPLLMMRGVPFLGPLVPNGPIVGLSVVSECPVF